MTVDRALDKVVDVAADAIGAAAGSVGPKFSEVRDQRRDKRAAHDLARTLGEKYVEIPLNSPPRRHYVVFRNGTPFRAFPALEMNLAEVEELHGLPETSFRQPPRRRRKR